MEFKARKTSLRQKIITACILLGIAFFMSAAMLHLWVEKNLTRGAIKTHRALVVDLGKENIAVGSLYDSSRKRVNVDKHNHSHNIERRADIPERFPEAQLGEP